MNTFFQPLRLVLFGLCLLSILVSACSNSQNIKHPDAVISEKPSRDDASANEIKPLVDVSTPEGLQMKWVLEVLNGETLLTQASTTAHLHQSFIDQIPAAAFEKGFAEMIKEAPWVPKSIYESSQRRLVLDVQNKDTLWRVHLTVAPEAPHKMIGLFLAPVPVDAIDPTSPINIQSAWVLEIINGGDSSPKALSPHFDSKFHAAISMEDLKKVLKQIKALRPFSLSDHQKISGTLSTFIIENKEGVRLLIKLVINPEEENKLSTFLIRPAPSNKPLPTSWKGIEKEMSPWMKHSQIYVAKVNPQTGVCSPVFSSNPTRPMALGSSFKLYILSALAKAVDEGIMEWTDELAIEDGLKSYPSGVMQNEQEGARFTLSYYAQKMISISDNTATDHLLEKLGRETVEAQMVFTGHHNPALNQPFISTKEMFILKMGSSAKERAEFIALDSVGKRKLLAEMKDTPLPPIGNVDAWTAPIDVESIEWFATGADLCSLHGEMLTKRNQASYKVAFEALSINDGGLNPNPNHWQYVGFKGGSEPGVLFLNYLIQDMNGQWFSLSFGWNDAQKTMPLGANYVDMAKAAVLLIEKEK